nr:MAG: hypothetical protein [Caudoviricetes sp.]
MDIYTREDLKSFLLNFILDKNGKISQGKFKSLSKEIILAINYHTSIIKTKTLTEKIYWIINDIFYYPKFCLYKNCPNPIISFNQQKYQSKFCCSSCNTKHQLTIRENPFSGKEGIQRRKSGMIKKYGVDHNMKTKNSLDKRVKTYLNNYGVDNPNKSKSVRDKTRKTNEINGIWQTKEQMDLYYIYNRIVWQITNRQNLKSLPNCQKRKHIKYKDAFSLDHKFSIKEGFLNNIPPYIIGNIINLEFIPAKVNSSKREKSSISKQYLFDSLFRDIRIT